MTMLFRTTSRAVRSTMMLSSRGNKNSSIKIEDPSANMIPYKGIDAAKRPVNVELTAGKSYYWCSCGHSITQPFCDGSHKRPGTTNVRPVKFSVEKSGKYLMCQCKQTENRPLCDGSHKTVSPKPASANASQAVMFGDNSPVYSGVAYKLGYKPKDGGFQ